MWVSFLISVLVLRISAVAGQNSIQNDLQYLKDEFDQLKSITDDLRANITSLEETNQELTRELHNSNQKFTSMNKAIQDDLVFLQQKITIQRMFTVQNSKALSQVQHNQVIKFDEITTNEGRRYDSKTGVFTADISGWYVFFVDIRVADYNHMCWSNLVKNNVGIVLTLSMSGGKGHEHKAESNIAVISLQLGDKVWIRSGPYVGSECKVDDHSSFSGFLLSAV